ncbi:hypothetical protein EBR25_12860 [bacterium]|nr:hypothetical protein [bacterium]
MAPDHEEEETLTAWTVSTLYKKSVEDYDCLTKDGLEIIHKLGWRSGSWTVYTTDGRPPKFIFTQMPGGNGSKDCLDILDNYGNIKDVELNMNCDGCWVEIEWPENLDEDEQERLQELIDEDGIEALEEQEDWAMESTTYIWGPILIEGENGYRKIIVADDDGNISEYKEEHNK